VLACPRCGGVEIDEYPMQGYDVEVIREVVITESAKKDLRRLPAHVVKKLRLWVAAVETAGLEEIRKIPGYHDEPLKGDREGQRSVRLNLAYRAIYQVKATGEIEFVSVEEVKKHDY
jgi:proteic killer suppression protein